MHGDTHEAARHGRARRGRILIVDDDTCLLLTMTDALRADGYHVRVAASYAALRITDKSQPDVIVLGIIPPLQEAIAACTYLRANPLTAHVPIIAMSTKTRLQALAILLPIDGRLPVPFDLMQLRTLVACWMPAPGSRGDERAAHEAMSAPHTTP